MSEGAPLLPLTTILQKRKPSVQARVGKHRCDVKKRVTA